MICGEYNPFTAFEKLLFCGTRVVPKPQYVSNPTLTGKEHEGPLLPQKTAIGLGNILPSAVCPMHKDLIFVAHGFCVKRTSSAAFNSNVLFVFSWPWNVNFRRWNRIGRIFWIFGGYLITAVDFNNGGKNQDQTQSNHTNQAGQYWVDLDLRRKAGVRWGRRGGDRLARGASRGGSG